jgi:hypothetical protein
MTKADDEEGEEVTGAAKRDRITIDPSPAMRRYLAQLVRLGIYGKTPTTVARRLIDEGVRLALKEGLIEKERDED